MRKFSIKIFNLDIFYHSSVTYGDRRCAWLEPAFFMGIHSRRQHSLFSGDIATMCIRSDSLLFVISSEYKWRD